MTEITVVHSVPEHLIELVKNIRFKDAQESLKLGFEPIVALTACFKHAILRNTVLIDGEVAAMFGVVGSFFADQNTLYLVTNETVKKVSHLTFVKVYLAELDKMMQVFDRLICYVDADYREAIKLLEFVGFEREQTLTLNNHIFYIYGLTTNGN